MTSPTSYLTPRMTHPRSSGSSGWSWWWWWCSAKPRIALFWRMPSTITWGNSLLKSIGNSSCMPNGSLALGLYNNAERVNRILCLVRKLNSDGCFSFTSCFVWRKWWGSSVGAPVWYWKAGGSGGVKCRTGGWIALIWGALSVVVGAMIADEWLVIPASGAFDSTAKSPGADGCCWLGVLRTLSGIPWKPIGTSNRYRSPF